MFTTLVLALAFGQAYALVAKSPESPQDPHTPKFVLDDKTGELVPYKSEWKTDPSLYKGLPLVEKTTVIDGKTVVYNDFNVSALETPDFQKYFMSSHEFHDENGKFIPTNEEVKAHHKSLIAQEEDPNAQLDLPGHLKKRAQRCSTDSGDRCKPACLMYINRGIGQSYNDNVYGAYHYNSDTQCGIGSISKAVGYIHSSSITFGGFYNAPAIGGGVIGQVTKFLSGLGISVSKGGDSVTETYTFTGSCDKYTVCALWERPHFSVDKGIIVTQYIDMDSRRTCRDPTTASYEAHIPHLTSDPGGAASHGICYTLGEHGCGYKPKASTSIPACVGGY